MKTTFTDYFTKETHETSELFTEFIHNGDIKKSVLNISDIAPYNDIDNLHCVFGADTSINFQYSFVVSLTDYTELFEKDCKGKKYTTKNTCVVTAISKLFALASYGFKVSVKKDGKVSIISPRYQKLTSIRRIIDGCEGFFNFDYIGCTRYDGNELIDNVDVNHGDIIKLAQAENRHFNIKWISNRVNKNWN